MAKVSLHIYDITNSPFPKTNSMILQINRITKDSMGLGGIFHGAVEVYGAEWSYGYCEKGSGVFKCRPKANPAYTYRETLELGVTPLDEECTARIIEVLGEEWKGADYDLLQRNCNHFCCELSQSLGTGAIPVWVNRLANMGDSAAEFAAASAHVVHMLQSSIYGAGQAAYRFLWGESDAAASASAESGSRGALLRSSPRRRGAPGGSCNGDSSRGSGLFADGPSGGGRADADELSGAWTFWASGGVEEQTVRDRLGLCER